MRHTKNFTHIIIYGDEKSSFCKEKNDPRRETQTPESDCLWLLDFSPDQVHRLPPSGPLIAGRIKTSRKEHKF